MHQYPRVDWRTTWQTWGDLIVIALFLTLFGAISYIHWDMWEDQSIYHYIAWGMQHGMKLYVDVIDMNWAGIVPIHLLARALSGKEATGLRFIDLASQFTACFIAAAIMRSWGIAWWQRLLSLSVYLATYFLGFLQATAQREGFATPLMLVALLPALLPATIFPTLAYFAFGLCAGYAIWLKPTFALIIGMPILARLFSRYSIKTNKIIVYIFGALLVSLIFVLWIRSMGSWNGFMRWCVQFAFGEYAESHPSWNEQALRMGFVFTKTGIVLPAIFLLTGFIFLTRTNPSKWFNTKTALLLVWLCISFLTITLQRKAYCVYHYIPWIMASCMTSAWLMSKHEKFTTWKFSNCIAMAFVLGLIILPFSAKRMESVTIGHQLATQIQLQPNDEIVILGFFPSLLNQLECKTSFPYLSSIIFYGSTQPHSPFRQKIVQDLVQAIVRPQTKYLLVQHDFQGGHLPDVIEHEIGSATLLQLGYRKTQLSYDSGRGIEYVDAYRRDNL